MFHKENRSNGQTWTQIGSNWLVVARELAPSLDTEIAVHRRGQGRWVGHPPKKMVFGKGMTFVHLCLRLIWLFGMM